MQFIAVWNDFLYSLLILNTEEMRTVTLALVELSTRTQAATTYGPLFAGMVLATVPTDRALLRLPAPPDERHSVRLTARIGCDADPALRSRPSRYSPAKRAGACRWRSMLGSIGLFSRLGRAGRSLRAARAGPTFS